MADNNDGYMKGYDLKTLPKVTRNYSARVIDDELKYIVMAEETGDPDVQKCVPTLGALGRYYDHFLAAGYRVKGIQLKNKHIEFPLQKLAAAMGGLISFGDDEDGETKSVRVQKNRLNRVALKRGQGWMSTIMVADRRINFPDQLFIIHSKQDIINIQKALIGELNGAKSAWVLIKRLVLEHIESGREIVNILKQVKTLDALENHQLYTSWIQKTNGLMVSVDHYSGDQLDFVYEGNGHNVYPHKCNKEVDEELVQITTCGGLVSPLTS